MSPSLKVGDKITIRFPRVSGDEPVTVMSGTVIGQFSPRERG